MRIEVKQVNGVATRIHFLGSELKPPIVCLHGLGGTGLSFAELAEHLTPDFHLISITIPGSGGTQAFPTQNGYAIGNLAEWLHDIVKQLSIEDFVFLGHSWGGQIGLFYLSRFGEGVAKCILIDGGYYRREVTHSESESIDDEIAALVESDNAYRFDSVDQYLAAERKDTNSWTEAKELAALDRAIESNGGTHWHVNNQVTEWALREIYASEPYTIYSELKSQLLGSKLMLLQATMPETRTDRDVLSAVFSNATGGAVVKMKGCGHSMHSEEPAEVAKQIRWVMEG